MTSNKKKSSKKEPTTKELITALTAKVQNLEQQVINLTQLVQQLLAKPTSTTIIKEIPNSFSPYEVTWHSPSHITIPTEKKSDNPVPDFKTTC